MAVSFQNRNVFVPQATQRLRRHLLKWFKTARLRNVLMSGPIVMEKAGQFANSLGVPEGQFKV